MHSKIEKTIMFLFTALLILGCNDNSVQNSFDGQNCKTYTSVYMTNDGDIARCDWEGGNNQLVCTFDDSEGKIISQYETLEDFIKEDSILGLTTRVSTYYNFYGSESFQYYSYNINKGLEEVISTSSGMQYELNDNYIKWTNTGFDLENRPNSGFVEQRPENECMDWTYTQNYNDDEYEIETIYEGEGECFLRSSTVTLDPYIGITQHYDEYSINRTTVIDSQELCRDSS